MNFRKAILLGVGWGGVARSGFPTDYVLGLFLASITSPIRSADTGGLTCQWGMGETWINTGRSSVLFFRATPCAGDTQDFLPALSLSLPRLPTRSSGTAGPPLVLFGLSSSLKV